MSLKLQVRTTHVHHCRYTTKPPYFNECAPNYHTLSEYHTMVLHLPQQPSPIFPGSNNYQRLGNPSTARQRQQRPSLLPSRSAPPNNFLAPSSSNASRSRFPAMAKLKPISSPPAAPAADDVNACSSSPPNPSPTPPDPVIPTNPSAPRSDSQPSHAHDLPAPSSTITSHRSSAHEPHPSTHEPTAVRLHYTWNARSSMTHLHPSDQNSTASNA
ncbi:hypothetical protein ACLOJK_038398 [Asimina triloba]